ncbi:MAG: hypothetical protein ACHQIM_17030 [Sphingobacteriales bacterium]
MKTLKVETPDKKAKRFKEPLKKYNTPNALTVKTINDAHNGTGIESPIENVRSFINSL